jgi:hypothetical protein
MNAVPDGLELAFLSNLEYFRELTRRSRGKVVDEGGVTCFASPHPMPFLVSGAFRTDPSTAPADVLARAEEFFAPMGRRIPVSALAGRDDDVIAVALDAGFTASDPGPLQVLSRRRLDENVIDVEFRTVTDAAGVSDYATVCGEAHASYGFPDDLFPTLFARPTTILAPHLHAVVGYSGDDPVAAASVYLTHGVAYVGWVAVASSQQRRGLGAAATALVVNRGFDLGATCATLLASPMGAPVYRRLGFVDVGGVVDLEPSDKV